MVIPSEPILLLERNYGKMKQKSEITRDAFKKELKTHPDDTDRKVLSKYC